MIAARQSPVFIVGSQRSGTTALAMAVSRAAARRGGLVTINGRLPYLLSRLIPQRDLAAGHVRVDDVIACLRRRPALGDGAERWLSRVEHRLLRAAREVADGDGSAAQALWVRDLVQACYDNPVLWGDKYNEYLLDLDELHGAFPDARWIYVARHPASVVASMQRWEGKPWNPATVAGALQKWMHWNSRWFAFRGRLAPARRLELRYETLPERARSIERLLGIDVGDDLNASWAPRPGDDVTPVPEPIAALWQAIVRLDDARDSRALGTRQRTGR